MNSFEANPFTPAPFPFLHPSKLRDAIQQMRSEPNKETKGLSLSAPLDLISFKRIRHGFMFAAQDKYKFFPMPTAQEIEAANLRFAKNM